ncbi:hypothetical protein TNCV_977611 [Trichonephila clavipes]|nr:hypothetical protein TNCV_977611 [Trichonephila clavipes]
MACDAEDCGFQMLNDDEIVTSVQEESDVAGDETDEDEDNNTMKIARVHEMLTHLPTRGLLVTDHVILNHGQVTWTTPELAPSSPNYHTTPTGGRFSSRQI